MELNHVYFMEIPNSRNSCQLKFLLVGILVQTQMKLFSTSLPLGMIDEMLLGDSSRVLALLRLFYGSLLDKNFMEMFSFAIFSYL